MSPTLRKIMSEPIHNLKPTYESAMDIRGEPTSVCPCGSFVWLLKATFSDDGSIGMYFRDMECAVCGTQATAPIEE